MNRGKAASILALGLLAGCIPLSLNPIYTDDVIVTDPRIEGVWGESEEDSFTIAAAENGVYRLTTTEDDKTWEYKAVLIKLRNDYFLDLEIENAPEYPDAPIELQLIPAHTFFRVVLSDATLRLDSLDMEWLVDRADRHLLFAGHARIEAFDDAPVFTCSSKRMQRFLRRWAHVDKAWSVGDEGSRVQPES